MNLKTTIVLALLVGAGSGLWVWLESRKPKEVVASPTLELLKTKLTPDKLTRIEARRDRPLEPPVLAANIVGLLSSPMGRAPALAGAAVCPRVQTLFVLEKEEGKGWTTTGSWPVRRQETEQWISVLTNLHSRFAPEAVSKDENLKSYGLADDALIIKVTLDKKVHTLRFGVNPDDNRFTRSTYLRLEDHPEELIQLGPGVLTALDRRLEYFQRRRLFDVERIAKADDSPEFVDALQASQVEVQSAYEKIIFAKKDNEWIVKEAHQRLTKLAASTAGLLLASPLGEGPLLAVSALFPGRTERQKDWQQICSEDRIE